MFLSLASSFSTPAGSAQPAAANDKRETKAHFGLHIRERAYNPPARPASGAAHTVVSSLPPPPLPSTRPPLYQYRMQITQTRHPTPAQAPTHATPKHAHFNLELARLLGLEHGDQPPALPPDVPLLRRDLLQLPAHLPQQLVPCLGFCLCVGGCCVCSGVSLTGDRAGGLRRTGRVCRGNCHKYNTNKTTSTHRGRCAAAPARGTGS